MPTMFQNATLKLTVWYLIGIMTICLGFSAAIYHFANTALQNGLHNQSTRILNRYPGFDFEPILSPADDLTTGSHRILRNLLYFNIAVLIAAGFFSHALARRTLSPIEQSHEQQKRFTADVSHQLRTPLTALKMSSEVALMEPKASKAELREALASNIEEANKLEQLVNNLLRLTKLEAAELQQQFTAVAADEVIAVACEAAATTAKLKDITLAQSTKPAMLRGDQGSLVQLVGILLDNAIKYSPPGSTVTIASEQAVGWYEVQINDHGSGIPRAALQHVFERFYRTDSARADQDTHGFGLGLSIARLIADIHGATITLTSTEGKGTTATVRLPFYDDKS